MRFQGATNAHTRTFFAPFTPFCPMTVWLLFQHVLSFVLPALAMAVFMPWAGRWVMGPSRKALRRHMFWHALLGVGVLGGGLALQGQDGTMATYVTLVLMAATLEWALHQGGASR
jgi:hypothetical protein